VIKGGETLLSLPLFHVSEVLILGQVGLTTPAIGTLLKAQIPVTFLSMRGEYKGRLVGATRPHVGLRRRQYACTQDPNFTLAMAQAFVRAKLLHLRVRVRRWDGDAAGLDESRKSVLQALDRALDRVPRTTRLTSLGGVEGSASAAYFSYYRRLFDPIWNFTQRARRPPPDPVNVLLSLGYTLLANAAHGAVEAAGLDPYAGFLHRTAYNRPSLALDVMEEFRAVVDGVVLGCCRSGVIAPGDFKPGDEKRPVVLDGPAKRRFIKAYEQRMDAKHMHPARGERISLRRCIMEQVRQVARAAQTGEVRFVEIGFK